MTSQVSQESSIDLHGKLGGVTTLSGADLVVSATDGIGTVTFNRPEKRNALTTEMRLGLLEALHVFESDAEIRCVILRGAGGAFCAGGDVGVQANNYENRHSAEEVRSDYLAVQGACVKALLRFPKPTLAAIDGPVAGAGVSIALLCDIRIASARSFLKIPFLDRGLVPDWLLMHLLPAYVGLGRTLDLLFLQETLTSKSAFTLGLLSSIYEDSEFEDAVEATSRSMASLAPIAVNLTKSVVRARLGDVDALLSVEALAQAICINTEDHGEGASAFLEKRRPHFLGR